MSQSIADRIQNELSDQLQGAFELVRKSREEHYLTNEAPVLGEIDSLISSCANKNSIISGGASLIPGPWGMAAVVPELVAVTRNQIGLIYDIGVAHGKKDFMSNELLMGVFLSAMGSTANGVLVAHGSKLLVRRASLQVMQKLITLLGGKITQAALKSAVSKWLPGIGAAAMAAWSNYMTRQIGKKADELLRQEIARETEARDASLMQPVNVIDVPPVAVPVPDEKPLEFYKLQILIGLAGVDGEISSEEEQFVQEALDGSTLADELKLQLAGGLGKKTVDPRAYAALSSAPDEAVALLTDMSVLAKKDQRFHLAEKLFIRQIAKQLGFSDVDVDEVIAAV